MTQYIQLLQSTQALNDPKRNSAIDIFRGVAIIAVILYHWGILRFGYLGVDLFFVISGVLIGGILIQKFNQGNLNYFSFFFRRGMKVWPSYYFFILVSVLISGQWNFPHLLKYLFFYQNYTGESSHIWSLCIEEHFYILLPFLFLSVLYLIPVQHRIKALFVFVSFVIISGILFKIISYSFTKSQDTYSATHNRIDALAWGVLLALLLNYSQLNFRNTYFKIIALASGFLILTAAISIEINTRWILFDKICFHSILPFAIFLILAGSYHINFSRIVVVRYIAYYSYNLYLWHLIVQRIIVNTYGDGIISLILDIIIGFFIAVLVTILIEEPCKNYFLYSNHEPTTPS